MLQQHQVVAVDDFEAFAGGEEGLHLLAAETGDPGDFDVAEGGLAAGDHGVVGRDYINDLAGRETTAGAGHTDGEQAAALVAEHGDGVGIDQHAAGGALVVGDPALARLQGHAGGNEVGAGIVAAEQAGEDVGLGAAGDEDSAPGTQGDLGRGDLGNHAARGGDIGGAAGHGLDFGRDLLDHGEDLARALHIDEAGGGGEDDELLGVDQAGDEGGEGIVVAELDLGGADGVVFVDNRHDAVADELLEAGSHAEVAGAGTEVLVGEQHLRDGAAVGIEGPLPGLHEQALPDGGAGLLPGDLGGLFQQAEAAHAETDRAGGDDDDLHAGGAQTGDAGGERADALRIQLADTVREHAGAEFDHEAAGEGGGGHEGNDQWLMSNDQ